MAKSLKSLHKYSAITLADLNFTNGKLHFNFTLEMYKAAKWKL